MVGLWKKESGNYLSHGKGLDTDQIAFLHSLKEGDRLIAWQNKKGNETSPDLTIKKFTRGE